MIDTAPMGIHPSVDVYDTGGIDAFSITDGDFRRYTADAFGEKRVKHRAVQQCGDRSAVKTVGIAAELRGWLPIGTCASIRFDLETKAHAACSVCRAGKTIQARRC